MAVSTSLTPEQLSTRGSISANERWAKSTARDREDNGRRGQAGLKAKFEREIREAIPGLTDAEYMAMAENKYQAHFQRMAFASSKARKARANGAA
jgi:hypothetical protein